MTDNEKALLGMLKMITLTGNVFESEMKRQEEEFNKKTAEFEVCRQKLDEMDKTIDAANAKNIALLNELKRRY